MLHCTRLMVQMVCAASNPIVTTSIPCGKPTAYPLPFLLSHDILFGITRFQLFFLVFMNSIDLNFNKYVFNLLYGTFSQKLYCNLLSSNCNLSNLLASAEVQMPNVQLATASVFSQKPDVSATPCHHLITLFSLNF